MREVLEQNHMQIEASDILKRQGLDSGRYFLVSLHRQENVDNPKRLQSALESLLTIRDEYGLPILVSTHPRTRLRLDAHEIPNIDGLVFHAPFGFHDYIRLQMNAKLVLSDSGTISEESSMLGFPAVTMRDFIERPEAQDEGAIIACGVNADSITAAVRIALAHPAGPMVRAPREYIVGNTAERVLAMIHSSVHSHTRRLGLLDESQV
jgi:UDP-N-acetylglucosamine 2-epimerase (non-hydrolysing)